MKTILASLGIILSSLKVLAQGTVIFDNQGGEVPRFRAPFYGLEPGNPTLAKQGNGPSPSIPAGTQMYGGPLLAGTGYTCQLWGRVGMGLPESALELLSTTTFRTGVSAGFIVGRLVTVPNAPIDGTAYFATFQVRAWDNQGGTITTWEQVEAANIFPYDHVVPAGKSWVFTPSNQLGGTGTPPVNSALLYGLESFNLYIVPEPSAVVLGLCGGAGLLVVYRTRRRGKVLG